MVVAHIRARHILVFNTRKLFANFSALHASDVSEHALISKVALREIVCAQCCRVVGRQSDEMMENTRFTRRVALEAANSIVCCPSQFTLIIASRH